MTDAVAKLDNSRRGFDSVPESEISGVVEGSKWETDWSVFRDQMLSSLTWVP